MHYVGRAAGLAAVMIGTTVLSGCYVPPPPPVAVATPTPVEPAYPPPAYGSSTPAVSVPSNAGGSVVVAPYGPPPLRIEAPPPAPSPMAVWQQGHWSWIGGQYAWAPGHYVLRPTAVSVWTPGYWQQGPAGWYWVEGHWTG